ncbi:MAG: hypothetical protein CVV41_04115 [Candidatus Riflebacteria bacterium HGW-Riflebacteria-1]|jgi:hypothetical protein|nr:MAG: hypothetical protein CVV41_04115 [Candidatus Riflebacteria bacterium HGW-Riflebacteria-1]
MALFRNRFCLFFLGLVLVFSTGCGGGGGSGSSQLPNTSAGTTTLSGSLLVTDPADTNSLRAVAAPTKAEISLSYLTAGGIEVPLKRGVVAQIVGNSASYEFNFDYDAIASTRRNFMLKAMLDNGKIIEGVIPMNPGDKKIKAPPITPLDTGMARFIKEAAIKGNSDVSIGDLMSMFPPKVLFGLSNADLQSLAAEFVNRETKMQTLSTQFGGEVAGKIAQLREFAYEAARDTREFMSKYPEMVNPTEMRERYEDMMRNRAQALGLPADALKAIETIDLQLVQGIGDRTGTMNLPADFIADFNGMGLVTEARSRMEMLAQTLRFFVSWSNIAELVKAFDLALAHMYNVVKDEKPENLDEFMFVDPAIMIFEKARFIIFKDLGLLESSPNSPPLIFALMPRPEDFGPISNQPPVDFNDDSVWILPYPGKDGQTTVQPVRSRLNAMMIQIGDPAEIADFQKRLISNLIERINKNFALLKFAQTPPTGDTRVKFVEALAVLLAEPMDPSIYGFDPGYNPEEPGGSEPGWEGPEPVDPIFERYQKLYGTLIQLEPAKIRNGVTYKYALTALTDGNGTTSNIGWANKYQAYIYDNNNDLEQVAGVTGVFVLKFLSEPLAGPTSSLPEAPGFTYVEHHADPGQ